MVGIVVVSHSRALADAAVALAGEMLHGQSVPLEVAAGLDDTTFGTDAAAIAEAVTAADTASAGAGVVVLMDMGSAVLSAELALELVEPDVRERAVLCPAPLVEGLVVASVSAAGGATRAEVAAEAVSGLAGKIAQLGAEQAQAPSEDETPEFPATGSFTVANPHGLHARPASRLASQLRGVDAEVQLRNGTTGSRWVSAVSLSKLATLGVLCGHELQVRARGRQADAAIEQLVELAGRNFDETPGQDAIGGRGVADYPTNEQSVCAVGARRPIGASPGLGIGPAWLPSAHRAPIAVPDQPAETPEVEWQRVEQALEATRGEIEQVRERTAREIGKSDAAIFDAHLALLEDPELVQGARRRIDSGQAAPGAWSAAVVEVHDELAALADPYLRARAADVDAVGEQVLRALLGEEATPVPTIDRDGVLVAADLTPAEAAGLDRNRVAAVVLAYGSPTAHSAILLRALGIPAVVAAGAKVLDIEEGTPLAVDGARGELIVNPDPKTRDGFLDRAAALAKRERQARVRATSAALTSDGVEIPVGANIGSVRDARLASTDGADFAGLVRTEFLFLDREQAPDSEEQEATYREIAAALNGRRITLRTLDVGGDKPLGYLPMPAEANPFLGLRGLRLSLARPELLTEQLLAIVRVAHDAPIDLMFPMVSTLDELFGARRLLDDAIKQVGRGEPAELRVGIMVEVPATALKAAAFVPHVDFFSIGTNDLTQYTLASERGNDAVAALGDPLDPGVLKLIDQVCRASGPGTPVSVCGELAADEQATALLLGLGVDKLSVTPRAVPSVKQAVRGVNRSEARTLATSALAATSADEVRALLPP